jgi:hypothetical protein
VPAPAAGQVRISYLNIHTADMFQDRFNRIAKPGSPWLAGKPRIMVWEEWSGIWDDADTPQSVHEGNIQYMKSRQASEGKRGLCWGFEMLRLGVFVTVVDAVQLS